MKRWKPLLCMTFWVMGSIPAVSAQAQTLEQYQSMLNSPDTQTRISALQAVEAQAGVLYTEPAVLDALAQAARDKATVVRREAVRILAQRRTMAALPPLLTALQDSDESIRLLAANGLGLLPSPLAVSALLKVLQDPTHRPSEAMQNVVIRSLGALGDAAATPAILKRLQAPQAPSERVKITAFIALGQLQATSAVPLLIQMPIETPKVKFYALQLLGQLGDSAAVPTLVQALDHDSEDIRLIAAEALGKIGEPAVTPALVRMLRDPSLNGRIFAIEALGHLGHDKSLEPQYSRQAVSALIQRLRDASEYDRLYAAKALGKIGDSAAVPALIMAMQDASIAVIHNAAQALVQLHRGLDPRQDLVLSQAIVQALIARVEAPQVSDALASSALAKREAAEALGQLGSASAIPVLMQVLDNVDSETADASLMAAAAKALGQLQATAAIPTLSKALRTGSELVRTEAAEALATLKDPRARAALLELLQNDSAFVRYEAAHGLGKLGDRRVVPPLNQALQTDPDSYVRSYAALALGALGDATAVPALIQALQDPSVEVKLEAANALGSIGDKTAVLPLIQCLATGTAGTQDDTLGLKQAVIRALGKLQDPRAVRPLIQHLATQNPQLKIPTVTVLGALGDPMAVAPLLDLFTKASKNAVSDEGVAYHDLRLAVAQALAQLKNDRGLPILLSALQTIPIKAPPPLKHYVSVVDFFMLPPPEAPPATAGVSIMDAFYIELVKSVGSLGDTSAVPVLQQLASRSSQPLRQQIEVTLKQLNERRSPGLN